MSRNEYLEAIAEAYASAPAQRTPVDTFSFYWEGQEPADIGFDAEIFGVQSNVTNTDLVFGADPTNGEAFRGSSLTIGGITPQAVVDTRSFVISRALYMVGSGNDALFTLDIETGVATRVGNVTNFGVGETSPTGLTTISGLLYMVGNINDALYQVNATTGVATRIGNANAFGVGEFTPSGIAYSSNLLPGAQSQTFMIGLTNTALYTLNIQTGVATRVGNANLFGVNETSPLGLTILGNSLYMVGGSTDALYTLNPSTGVATRVGNVVNFGAGEASPTALATFRDKLYMLGATNDALYTLDTTTGVATRVGNANQFGVSEGIPTGLSQLPTTVFIDALLIDSETNALFYRPRGGGDAVRIGEAENFGVGETRPRGLALLDRTLYMVGEDNATLYTLDTETGIATQVGPSASLRINVGGFTGLDDNLYTIDKITKVLYSINPTTAELTPITEADSGSALYMVGDDTSALHTIDIVTGQATRVGNAYRFGVNESLPRGLTAIGDILYMVGRDNSELYTVDRTTGVATRIGNVDAFGVGEISPSGLTSIDETLYMIGGFNDALYTVDTTTGVATRIGNVDNFGANVNGPTGLATFDGTMYLVDANQDALFTVDRTTGVATRVSNVNQFGINESFPNGLTILNGSIYMLGATQDRLYTVDPSTGTASRRGSAVQFGVNESRASGLAGIEIETIERGISPTGLVAYNDQLYTLNSNSPSLHVLDTTTGEDSIVGESFSLSSEFSDTDFNLWTSVYAILPRINVPQEIYVHDALTWDRRDKNGIPYLTCRIEDDAPRDAGEDIEFIGIPFNVTLPRSGSGEFGAAELILDNVGHILPLFKQALEQRLTITCTYRPYLYQLRDQGPQIAKPIVFQFASVAATSTTITGELVAPRTTNQTFPRDRYDINRFPGLYR